jgi:hypothetical protein
VGDFLFTSIRKKKVQSTGKSSFLLPVLNPLWDYSPASPTRTQVGDFLFTSIRKKKSSQRVNRRFFGSVRTLQYQCAVIASTVEHKHYAHVRTYGLTEIEAKRKGENTFQLSWCESAAGGSFPPSFFSNTVCALRLSLT